jgi:hypothetical protein
LNRWLLNFDVRTAKDLYVSRHWLQDSRAQYLLRPEIEWPLSVDTFVWPSVFFSEIFRNPAFESYSTIEIDPQVHDQLQLDLDRMRDYYDSHRTMAPDGVFVGIELLSERTAEGETLPYELPEGIQCAIWLEQTVPARLPDGSTLLGYDVADAARCSGLSNCGYTEEEIRDLSPVWAERLNSFGLFSSLDDAVVFRELSDRRVAEHAPFWIYGLWRLPSLIPNR